MVIRVGVLKEERQGEQRVTITDEHISLLRTAGIETLVEEGAGAAAGVRDDDYRKAGATVARFQEVIDADIVIQFAMHQSHRLTQAPLRSGQLLIGFWQPYELLPIHRHVMKSGASAFSAELIPRITRAQGMDILSAMANVAGYKAALVAATYLPKMFPLMMTAAGTVTPSAVLVIGAGVAGLQAIATAQRLGAVVKGYDVRSEVKEQIESLGATFVELPLESAAGEGGYAREMDKEFYRRQQELLSDTIAESDAVITTAVVPGKKAPQIISASMVERMRAGSVIVDLAADRGGNCELTIAGKDREINGVSIIGAGDLAATVPATASRLCSKNMIAIINHIAHDGSIDIRLDDEIIDSALIIHNGQARRPELGAA